MARVARQPFRRSGDFIAVRRIRLSAEVALEPGTKIDKKIVRLHQLRHWYQRRRIGVQGSDWAKSMLENVENSHARPDVVVPVKKTAPKTPDVVQDDDIALPESVSIERSGPGWITILLEGEEVDKVRGDDALKAWLKDNGYDS